MPANSLLRRIAKRVLFPLLGGSVYSRVQARVKARDIRRGSWFEDEIELLSLALAPGETALDVGANFGLYSYHLSRAVGPSGRVYAFEPIRFTADTLERVIGILGLANVEVFRLACGEAVGSAAFVLPAQPSGDHRGSGPPGAGFRRCPRPPGTVRDRPPGRCNSGFRRRVSHQGGCGGRRTRRPPGGSENPRGKPPPRDLRGESGVSGPVWSSRRGSGPIHEGARVRHLSIPGGRLETGVPGTQPQLCLRASGPDRQDEGFDGSRDLDSAGELGPKERVARIAPMRYNSSLIRALARCGEQQDLIQPSEVAPHINPLLPFLLFGSETYGRAVQATSVRSRRRTIE